MAKVSLVEEVCWPFERKPCVLIKAGAYARTIEIDPFPCYHHDLTLVNDYADLVMTKFPVDLDVAFYVLKHECISRTNGATMTDVLTYEDGKPKDYASAIYFSAKRIPPHPAFTRYLVAHEYGHVVEDHLLLKMGKHTTDKDLIDEYAELRGLEKTRSYGGGVWHLDNGEIFANDFRLLVTGVEGEYWPHEAKRPELEPKVIEWWAKQGVANHIPHNLKEFALDSEDLYYEEFLDIMERLAGIKERDINAA